MHPSAKRLLDAAIEATRGKAVPVVDFASLAKSMGISPQRLNAWKNRGGVSKEGAIEAEKLYGCSVAWIMEGLGKPPVRGRGIAQQAILNTSTVALQRVRWEDVVGELPDGEFRVAMPDDAMAPDAREGWEVVFAKASSAQPGQGVLIKDGAGTPYFRKYHQGHGKTWEAHPNDKSFLKLLSERDELEIIAVMKYILTPRLS